MLFQLRGERKRRLQGENKALCSVPECGEADVNNNNISTIIVLTREWLAAACKLHLLNIWKCQCGSLELTSLPVPNVHRDTEAGSVAMRRV